MAPKSNVPIRIGGSKVRTGCQTCKQRHVKCDEGRPVCVRCQTAKRQCIYVQPQPEQLQLRRVQRTTHTLNLSPSPFGPREIIEVNAVKSFTTDLGRELAGCFSDDVWCRVLPLVAQYEPTIWHGIVAVSTLSESVRLGGVHHTGPQYQMAIKQYTKAIQGLNLRLGSGLESEPGHGRCAQKHVVLLSCILFSIFECTRNHWHSALRHICGGVKLIEEWNPEIWNRDTDATRLQHRDDQIFGYFDHSSLIPTFFSLDSQAVKFSSLVFPERLPPSVTKTVNKLQVPHLFTTVEDANSVLSYIFNRVMHWLYWHERPGAGTGSRPTANMMTAERHRLRTQLAQWDSAFMSMRSFCLQPAALLLLVQKKTIQIQLEKHSDDFDNRPSKPSEMGWDKYLPQFQEAVEHAEAYFQLVRPDFQLDAAVDNITADIDTPSELPKQTFTISTDFILPLCAIIVKCRDSSTRRRALKMLKNYSRTEGLWDSRVCASASEQMVILEESGATDTGFIPDSARIYEVDLSVGQEDGQGAMTSAKHVQQTEDGGHQVEKVETHLSW